ncbi:MAG: pyridoxal-phosphate-dependent aminotransferase family protein [Halanaerobiales bacterium]
MKELLMLPGPTPLPPQVIKAQSRQIIGHREKEFEQLLENITENLKQIFFTTYDPLIFPASGTGGLEIAVVNALAPGDKILSISNGIFGERFRQIARKFNIQILELDFPSGKACDYNIVEDYLNDNPDLQAVLFTHNETSTGVTNNVQKLGSLLKNRQAILLVDAVSSLGGIPLKADDWGLDIVITSSQKALMTPPGLAILSISKKAWAKIKNTERPVYFWNLLQAKKYYQQRKQTPYTPAVTLLFALQAALKIILDQGLETVFKQHKLRSRALREGMKILNFNPFVEEKVASATVSAFYQPENMDFPSFKKHLLNNYKLHFATGQQQLRDKIFRIGHMGHIGKNEIINTIKALGQGLKDFNYHPDIQKAILKTEEVLKCTEY